MTYAEIITLAMDLKAILEADERVVHLQDLDQQLNQQQALIQLSERYQQAQANYQAMWESYGDDHPHLLKARSDLHQVKTQVDQHPLVRSYLQAYGQVRQVYQLIQQKIFSPFKAHPPGCE